MNKKQADSFPFSIFSLAAVFLVWYDTGSWVLAVVAWLFAMMMWNTRWGNADE